ncbi:MAG: hypothetical protein ABSE63_06280 [Thermoguttaceae bacterium]|jgi:hypothetical protein
MNNDPEQILSQIKPCGTDNHLRLQVLSAVDSRLRESRHWQLQKRIGLITLAMVIFGAGLNIWVDHDISRRIAALFPPPTPSRNAVELAAFVSKYTDPQAGQWVYRQLAVDHFYSFSPEDYVAYIQKITAESESLYKDKFYEKSEKNSPLDRHKPGNVDRNPADMRGMLFLDSRLTA